MTVKLGRKRYVISLYDAIIVLLIIACTTSISRPFNLGMQALAILITLFRMKPLEKKEQRQYLLWILLFTFYCLISLTWKSSANTTVLSSTFSVLQAAAIGFCIICYAKDERRTRIVVGGFIIAAGIICFRIITQIDSLFSSSMRLTKALPWADNSTAMMLAWAALILFWVWITKHREKKTWKNLIVIAVMLMFLLLSIMLGTKKGILIFFIGLILVFASRSTNILKTVFYMLAAVVIAIGLYLSVTELPFLYNTIGSRFEGLLNVFGGESGDGSSRARLFLLIESFEVFLQNPIFGIGQDGFRYVSYTGLYSHVNYTELLANLGVLGFSLYYWYPLMLLKRAFRFWRNHSLIPIMLLIFFVVDFASISYSYELTYVLFAIIVSILRTNERKNYVKEKQDEF